MKKLNAISIDKTKLIPDEELKIIRGGPRLRRIFNVPNWGFDTIRITALFLISVLIVSCRGGSGTMFNAATLPYKVDIEKYYDNVKPVPLSSIGEELVYVPLETRPDLVLGQVQPLSVEVYDSLIFINDTKQLYLFDINGKFIRKIGRIGRGPGEYLLPYFTVDNDNRLVYVGGSDKINCFDFDGNDMGSFALDFYVLNFIVNNDGTILFQKENYSTPYVHWPDSVSGWYITDGKGEVVSKIRSSYGNNFTSSMLYLIPTTMYRYNNTIHFKELFSDTLFCFMGDIKVPYAIFNYGKYWQDVSLLQHDDFFDVNAKKVLRTSLILEDDSHLFFRLYFSETKISLCVYNKKTGEVSILEGEGFVNDIDKGLSFWPKFGCDDGKLVDFRDAYTFIDDVDKIIKEEGKSGLGKELPNIYDTIEETSNPIIIFLE